MVELELAKSFLTEPDDPDVLRLAQFEGLEDLYGTWTDGRVTRRIPLLTEQLENLTFVINGASGLAKTALCKSIAAEYARCRTMPYFVCSSTADRLL